MKPNSVFGLKTAVLRERLRPLVRLCQDMIIVLDEFYDFIFQVGYGTKVSPLNPTFAVVAENCDFQKFFPA
jgi:hypothetical protein